MKKNLLVFFLCLGFAMLFGQDSPEVWVLRRVYIAPIDMKDFQPPSESEAFARRLPAMLFSAISELQPCVAVYEPQSAHSQVYITITQSTNGLLVQAVLSDNGMEQSRRSLALSDLLSSGQVIQQFLLDTAREFAPFLSEVPQQVNRERIVLTTRRQQVEVDIAFELAASSRFELGLSVIGPVLSYGSPDIDNQGIPDSAFPGFHLFPLIMDLAIYGKKSNTALLLALYLDVNNFQVFYTRDRIKELHAGSDRIMEIERVEAVPSNNLTCMAGLGFRYRSLGRFSASFSALLYAGLARVELLEPAAYYYLPSRDADYILLDYPSGTVQWLPAAWISLGQGFYFNLTPGIYLGLSMEMFFNPLIIINNYNRMHPYNMSTTPLQFKIPGMVGGIRF